MKVRLLRLVGSVVIFLSMNAWATVHYVDLNSTNATPPYTDWSTAATNIQEAIDTTTNGDIVLVTNGIYDSGGVAIEGGTTNRIAITNAITVQSVNGPWVTIIQGGGPKVGPDAVRCAWLADNATLAGFTLMWGATTSSDGQGGGGVCCGLTNSVVANCLIVSNTAANVGLAVFGGLINNCFISSSISSTTSFYAVGDGAILNSCTIVSNNSGGVSNCRMTNCIDYYNNTQNVFDSLMAYCCATPSPSGNGNISTAPQLFADGIHLLSTSPCIGAGTNLVTGTDIFGRAWSNPPSMGCAEYTPAPVVTQPSIILTGNPLGFAVNVAAIGSSPLSFYWFEDGVQLQNNGPFTGTQTANLEGTSVSLADAGDFQCVASNAFGVTTSTVVTLAIHCVDAGGTNPEPPYLTWAAAATNIQDAIDASESGDIVLVTNGVYSFGTQSVDGVSSNRVTLNKAIRVQSVNGPWVTTIQGAGATNGTSAIRCAWLTNNAALVGFTLEAGATQTSESPISASRGGAVWCASSNAIAVDNCVIVSNATYSYGIVYQGTLNNCLVSGNTSGGAASVFGAVLHSCTVVSNTTYGGATQSSLTNCIIYYNRVQNLTTPGSISYCCTMPPITGLGNFTNAPELQPDGVHLSSGSPCIGAGTNLVVGTDIFGLPWANPPSIGCAEFVRSPTVSLPQITFTGSPVGFNIGNVTLTGQPPFSFQWLEDGVPLETNGNFGATQTTNLVVTGVNSADAGSYQLVVSNAYGIATSAVVQLNIHAVDLASTNPEPPFLTWATAATNIQDAIEAASAGDIVLVTNGIYDTGGEVTADGLSNRVVLDKALMVASLNGHAVTVIQGAWDPVSTNGPAAVRCAWLTNGAVLGGFTLQNGATLNTGIQTNSQSGGGAWCVSTNALVSNCLLSNNFANYGGGGIAFGTLNNSLEVLNVADYGGGAYEATLNNCTVQNNSTTIEFSGRGAGTFGGVIQNSIVVANFDGYPYPLGTDNIAPYPGGLGPPEFSYCCTEGYTGPFPSGSGGNIYADPEFLDWYHISIYSPCRGAGSALYASGTDLDGEPWNDPPSIGCDEVVVSNRVGPLSVTMLPLETNVLVLGVDSFFGTITGLATYSSWNFGDGPGTTNADNTALHYWSSPGDYNVVFTAYNLDNPSGVSVTQVIHVAPLNAPQLQSPSIVSNNLVFQFTVQNGASYIVQYATNLVPPVTWSLLQSFPAGSNGVMQIQDSAPTNATRFYRVVAQ
jgi:hypothetical protein